MSNSRFLLLLAAILLVLLLIGIQEVRECGPFAGIWIGVIILPTMFITSLMVGVLCGLRKPCEKVIEDEEANVSIR